MKRDCQVSGCDGPAKTRGMCGMHAERVRKGLPLDAPRMTVVGVPFEDRYSVVPSGCWEWQGHRSTEGYGTWNGGWAHRISYERSRGPIPDGLHIDHLCRNRACVNPDHLEPVTPRVNTLRGMSPSAIVVRTGYCHRGHEFTPENTYVRPSSGHRKCRACIALWRENRKASA